MEQNTVFPIVGTKIEGLDKKFDLADPESRKEYFEAKVGPEIEKLKEFFADKTFIAYLLGKKSAGKGTYTKLLAEIFGNDKIGHLSVGDTVRAVHEDIQDPAKKQELVDYLQKNYRGFISIEQALDILEGRDTTTLQPTEFILTLLKREIEKMPKKSLFIDGFPRNLDQISFALYFRDLINFREDPDIFVAINIPENVIEARMKSRVVCPKCKTPRSLELLATKKAGYDKEKDEFYLICDNPECGGERMVSKEGDNLGLEAIRDRLNLDDQLIQKITNVHGVPKVLLRNAIPVENALELFDDYEITPAYSYEVDGDEVKIKESPWTIKDDDGVESYSLMAPPVVVSWIKQLVKVFDL